MCGLLLCLCACIRVRVFVCVCERWGNNVRIHSNKNIIFIRSHFPIFKDSHVQDIYQYNYMFKNSSKGFIHCPRLSLSYLFFSLGFFFPTAPLHISHSVSLSLSVSISLVPNLIVSFLKDWCCLINSFFWKGGFKLTTV